MRFKVGDKVKCLCLDGWRLAEVIEDSITTGLITTVTVKYYEADYDGDFIVTWNIEFVERLTPLEIALL